MIEETREKLTYQTEVKVKTHMFGSFSQWLCFDFGDLRSRGKRDSVSHVDSKSDSDAVIQNFGRYTRYIQKLILECGSRVVHERVRAVREKLKFDRWTRANRTVVPYDFQQLIDESFTKFQHKFDRTYGSDKSVDELVISEMFSKELNRDNYRHHMHNLITLEELTEQRYVSEYEHLNMYSFYPYVLVYKNLFQCFAGTFCCLSIHYTTNTVHLQYLYSFLA